MNADLGFDDRRADARFPVRIPVYTENGGSVDSFTSTDLSVGGACLEYEGETVYEPGDKLRVALRLPNSKRTVEVDAEVRWTAKERKRFGIRFGQGARAVIAALIASIVSMAPVEASAEASVPTFDPHADTTVDGHGSGQRPDEYTLMEAFQTQFEAFDKCVAKAKGKSNKTLEGSAKMQVLLNPSGSRPLGINADMPQPHAKKKALRECLRRAAAAAPFPGYDGPPIVAEFEFELDPGYVYEEE